MYILIFILTAVLVLIVDFIAVSLSSIFSPSGFNPVGSFKVAWLLVGISVFLSLFHIWGLMWMIITTIASLVWFMYILDFEPKYAVMASILASGISVITIFLLLSLFNGYA